MSNNQDKDSGGVNNSTQVPQVIYGYPPPVERQNEIDLGDLLIRLLNKSKAMLFVVVLGSALSVATALLLPNIYRQDVILSKPVAADISELNVNGYTDYGTKEIFKRYYDELRSPANLEQFVKENDYIAKLYPDRKEKENKLIKELLDDWLIEIIEPRPRKDEEVILMPDRVRLVADHKEEAALVSLLNDFVRGTENKLLSSLAKEQRWQVENEISLLEKRVELLRLKAKREREYLISRIEEEDAKQIAELKNKIQLLISTSLTEKEHQLARVKEAYDMAGKLGIKKPTYLSDLGRVDRGGVGGSTEINLTDRQELPLYLMGTNFLEARSSELKNREDEVPFIKDYNEYVKQLQTVENNQELKLLKARTSDDPFIEELPALLSQRERLEKLSFDFKNVDLYRLEKAATETGVSIKPNRKLIILGGVVLSFFLALVFGLILLLSQEKKQKN